MTIDVGTDVDSRIAGAFWHAAVPIGIADLDGNVLEANDAAVELIGIPADRMIGTSVLVGQAPDERRATEQVLESLRAPGAGPAALTTRFRRADGTVGVVHWSVTRAPGDDPYVVAVGHDVTMHRRTEQALRYQAQHDELTGLPNRRRLADAIDSALGHAGPIGLCYLDLDDFKAVNDRFGHRGGDDVLVAVGRRLRAVADARPGLIVARMGGDEFVALLPQATDDSLTATTTAMANALADPVAVRGVPVRVTGTVGAVLATGTNAGELLAEADTRMYEAKRTHRGIPKPCAAAARAWRLRAAGPLR
ncbi:diguanylate cyclase [Tsukamurella sp. 8F]|uniref:diguanylate cyclase domain-containing protein n=1 Tax=unclassified Tsukamurella TaxID=2633480 RepID=UPI0023B94F5B|nr:MULTISPECIES: diguanylate cyclase [unclassified Tsukamurella]MDF0530634.1 diguanylate cyclase [Tsukamurella sp. 8J]MDF0587835.1 diguanylate cyclase [Tsukamurella sp. 8F]